MLGPVSISVPTLVVELVIFLLMVYAMETLVFGPIRRAWRERDVRIQQGLNASNLGRDEAEQARQEVQRILQQARHDAQGFLDQATAAGNKVRDEKLAEAQARFREQVDQTRREIVAEREQSAAQLRERIVDIALEAASAVTGQNFDQPRVRELAASVVQQEGLA